MTRLLQLSCLLAVAGCATIAGPGSATREEDQLQISRALQRYEQALNQSDVGAVMALYGRDPVFMPQHAPALVGREAVQAGYQHVFATLRLAVRFELHELEVLGDQAWARTSSAGTQTRLASGEQRDEGNNELFVFRREGGAWRIHRYLFATNRPERP